MKEKHVDQLGRLVEINAQPKRIISLVPSQSELLCYLGLSEQLVGITKFCVHPRDMFKSTEKIGGTKQLKLDKIRALNPDLIIGNKEENERNQIETLAKEFPVWLSDIQTLEEALQMISSIGNVTKTQDRAAHLVQEIKLRFQTLAQLDGPRKKVAYFIWRKPYMVAARATFIDNMLEKSGFQNAFSDLSRYPEISPSLLKQRNPELILLSSEPFPFQEKHLEEFQFFCPKAVIKIVDGELYSWYGSRLLHSAAYFLNLNNDLRNS